MGDGYNFKTLQKEILAMSEASDWETARKEWCLIGVEESEEPETCLCGHFPIIEICTIHNRITNKIAEVGNRCVKRFLGFRSDRIFDAIKKVRRNSEKSLNADALSFLRSIEAITDWEYGFLQDTMRKRKLSYRQLEKRKSINNRIILLMSQNRLQAGL